MVLELAYLQLDRDVECDGLDDQLAAITKEVLQGRLLSDRVQGRPTRDAPNRHEVNAA